jgi:hypothetical protein
MTRGIDPFENRAVHSPAHHGKGDEMHICKAGAWSVMVALGFTGIAQAGLSASPLTNERDAAAGLVAAFQLRTEVPWEVAVLTYRARDYTDRALRILAANTTPAALLATPNGQSFPCAISGSVNARLSRTLPRTVKLEWNACVFENGIRHSLTGPGEVELPADTFSPAYAKSVRVGNATRDLTDQLDLLFTDPSVPSTVNTFNIRLAGIVPLARATDTDLFEGSFSYDLSGRAYERVYFQRAGEGDTFFAQEMSVTATNGHVSGYLDYGRRDDLRVSGRLDWWTRQDASSQEPEYTDSSRIDADGLRLQTVWDDAAAAQKFSIDGRVAYTWPQGYDMNCGCATVYSYDTKIAARRAAGYNDVDFYDAGKIVINGNATASFSLVGNPDDGQVLMHTDLDVSRVGSFDFETEPENLWNLQYAARCPQ